MEKDEILTNLSQQGDIRPYKKRLSFLQIQFSLTMAFEICASVTYVAILSPVTNVPPSKLLFISLLNHPSFQTNVTINGISYLPLPSKNFATCLLSNPKSAILWNLSTSPLSLFLSSPIEPCDNPPIHHVFSQHKSP